MEYTVGQALDQLPETISIDRRHNIFVDDYKNLLDATPNKWVAMDVIDISGLDSKSADYIKTVGKYYHRAKAWNKKYSDYEFKNIKTESQFIMFGKRVIDGI